MSNSTDSLITEKFMMPATSIRTFKNQDAINIPVTMPGKPLGRLTNQFFHAVSFGCLGVRGLQVAP